MTRSLLALALLFTGCDSGGTTDSGSDECGVTVTTFPNTGAVDAYYRGNIEFSLSKADSTATIETTIPGAQSVSADGLTVYWTPSSPLSPSTPYSATLHYCSGDIVLEFTTSALGTPVTDPQTSIKGSSYLLNLKDARVTEPAGVGALISSELGDVAIYVNATEVTDTEITMIGALGNAEAATPTQDWCSRTIPFPIADFTGKPYFSLGGDGTTTITVAGVSVDIQSLLIAGDFSADGSYFGGGVLQGTIDTRPLDDAFFDGETGSLCTTAGSLGATCEACSDGEVYCLSLKVDSITAVKTDIEVTEILGDDCLGCATGVPAENTDTCVQEPV